MVQAEPRTSCCAKKNTAAKHQCGHFKVIGRPVQRGSHRPNVEQSEQWLIKIDQINAFPVIHSIPQTKAIAKTQAAKTNKNSLFTTGDASEISSLLWKLVKESSSSQDITTWTGFQGNHNLLYASIAVNTSGRMTELESYHFAILIK